MMLRNLFLTSALIAVSTLPALAQERIRSSEYEGDEAVEACFDWQTSFEYTRCERLPIPGQTGLIGQIYTLQDGTKRTLTVDPRSVERDAISEAADTGDMLPPVNVGNADDSRASVGAGIDAAARDRRAQPAEPPVTVAASDGAKADEKSSIVAEDFILPSVVPYIPGRSEIMAMATGHLNRIETPFRDPMVRSSAQADAVNIVFDQNFVYVSVTQPVTLFIHEKGHPDPAIVISLVPQLIAPRQVKITLPPTVMEVVKKNAAVTEKPGAPGSAAAPDEPKANSKGVRRASAPSGASSSLGQFIQTFAQGRIPRGFTQVALSDYQASTFCKGSNGVTFSFRQGAAIASNEYIILRGMASANRQVELDERDCAKHPETLAVAFAPRTIVSKDHPTDFFVLIRRPNAGIQSARGGE